VKTAAIAAGWECEEADLYFKCSVKVRDDHQQFVPGLWTQTYGADNGLRPVIISKPELQLAFDSDRDYVHGFRLRKTKSNAEELEKAAAYYIAAERLKYEQKATGQRDYIGLLAIDPDAALHSVTWRWGEDGEPFTSVSLGREHNPWVDTYEQRRTQEALTQNLRDNGGDWVRQVLGKPPGWKPQ